RWPRVRLRIRRSGVPGGTRRGSDGARKRSSDLRSVERPAFFPGFEHRSDRSFDRQRRVVQQERAFGWLERRCAAMDVASVARLEIGTKTVDIRANTLSHHM